MAVARRGFPAKRLTVRIHAAGRQVIFKYEVDGGPPGAIVVRYPTELAPQELSGLSAIGVGMSAYLGQLCLARTIELDFAADPRAVSAIAPLTEMLYDIRRWRDEADLLPPPKFVLARKQTIPPLELDLHEDRSMLLFSGGKDSTLAARTLERNGYMVEAVHFTINEAARLSESRAVGTLSKRLGLSPSVVDYRHADFLTLSRHHAVLWDEFPYHNNVPFGRDLVLAVLAVPLMISRRVGILSFGHDNDCGNAYVTHQGKEIPRNDIESVQGSRLLEEYLHTFVLHHVRMLPPLARMSEFRILRELVDCPELLREISFCFWGQNCGRCAKCLRYFLAQRLFGDGGAIRFTENPLKATVCPELEDVFSAFGRERMLFDVEVLYMLGRLVERGDIEEGENALLAFQTSIYPKIAHLLDRWEVDLLKLQPDPRVPAEWIDS